MMLFNAVAIHRAGKAAAEGARLENQRVGAEAVVHEFDALTRQLNELKFGRAWWSRWIPKSISRPFWPR